MGIAAQLQVSRPTLQLWIKGEHCWKRGYGILPAAPGGVTLASRGQL
jgi:hypothetical protein